MLFLVLSDEGIDTIPLDATSLTDAAAQLKERYGQGTGEVALAICLPDIVGTIIQDPNDPANATISQTGDAGNQATIRQHAQQALANNASYLALQNPTNAQVVAQVKALTQQADGLIRLAVGDFSATT